ncbi:hypothetical protein LINGRAHAP2_LOCUS3914 [Linum grandiflorum]
MSWMVWEILLGRLFVSIVTLRTPLAKSLRELPSRLIILRQHQEEFLWIVFDWWLSMRIFLLSVANVVALVMSRRIVLSGGVWLQQFQR